MDSEGFDTVKDIEDLITSEDVKFEKKHKSERNITSIINKKKVQEIVSPDLQIYSSIIPGTQTIFIKTWGCTHNTSDSEYMAGQLSSYGYTLTDNKYIADLWILNSCTVKNPAEDHFRNEIQAAKKFGKHIIVAGCVPQGAPKSKFIQGLSIIGVQQIDRVVEVVEETLKGNTVKFLKQKKNKGKKLGGASLLLPKIRRNQLIEIIPINTGCLNQCTYCKTKHARGELGSYTINDIIDRAQQAFSEGVKEIWLTSEDTGCYGRDIGTNLPQLLWRLIDIVPSECRIRIGMTNPPYILQHLNEMIKILRNPKVYSFLHIPVQSGSDTVLYHMKREYTRFDFEYIVDTLNQNIPGISIATDIICGFPNETEEDFEKTLDLCKKYKFPSVFINQFFSRPGTPAALMNQVPAKEIKRRTKTLSEFFQSYEPYTYKVGEIQHVLVTEIAYDKKHYVGHNKFYEQVLIPMKKESMGKIVKVKIVSASKFSLKGEFLSDTSKGFTTRSVISFVYKLFQNFIGSYVQVLIAVVICFYVSYYK
ncbi:threonylcarbamoyladenosine tRNA methylthiotransferase [Copidosoma floridanum]|uniref:threonylcarbamoyladenosine tRNA methylthiotransferase n=1 Tax=Copidosoma floridanum TaxID=29053 RepID=UPI0006C961F8|nr:threonylcarbamoyladenosine tRNA methylthiotransferase [Copidosoma floridanum]